MRRTICTLKPDNSFLTDVDLAVEDLIRSRLQTAFPDHGILGEERPETTTETAYQWVIDPVDGTHSLTHGIPLCGTLLALRHGEKTIVGLIDLPGLEKTYVDPPPLVVPLLMIEQRPFPPGGAERKPVETAGSPRAPAAGSPASCAA